MSLIAAINSFLKSTNFSAQIKWHRFFRFLIIVRLKRLRNIFHLHTNCIVGENKTLNNNSSWPLKSNGKPLSHGLQVLMHHNFIQSFAICNLRTCVMLQHRRKKRSHCNIKKKHPTQKFRLVCFVFTCRLPVSRVDVFWRSLVSCIKGRLSNEKGSTI